ncbi:MAG: hypothetical protein WBG32_20075 [Nodosilinea sp.]
MAVVEDEGCDRDRPKNKPTKNMNAAAPNLQNLARIFELVA